MVRISKRAVYRVGNTTYYADGSGRLRDLGPVRESDLEDVALFFAVPLVRVVAKSEVLPVLRVVPSSARGVVGRY